MTLQFKDGMMQKAIFFPNYLNGKQNESFCETKDGGEIKERKPEK